MSDKKECFEINVIGHKTFQYVKNGSLLDNLEQQKIEVHYHCREGFCGACRTKLVRGEVEYNTDPLAYFDDDEILPCCCVPTSDIEIKVT